MDSEEVRIVQVETNADCVCLSSVKKKAADNDCIQVVAVSKKGKEPASHWKAGNRKRGVEESDDIVILNVTKQQKSFKPDCSDFDCIISKTTSGPSQAQNSTLTNSLSSLTTHDPVQQQELISVDSANSDKQSVVNESKMEQETQPTAPSTSRPLTGLDRLPTCWTPCPKCLPTDKRRYHLIDVTPGSSEWQVVSDSLTKVGFTVHKVQRIQNESLWQRLMFEKNLMLRDREDVNMQLLYHTTRAQAKVICEEGLDLRLSRSGRFGTGIYFSDDPTKCNSYWNGGIVGPRQMFLCRVLLGDIKEYQENKEDRRLVREPLKEHPKPGEPKTYDSVKGRMCGQNEYVVYNAYRVMPEYLLEYTLSVIQAPQSLPTFNIPPAPALPNFIHPQVKRRRRRRKT